MKEILNKIIKDNHFSFINNGELKEEMNISLSFVSYLVSIINSLSEEDLLFSAYFQTIIIHLWSIVEALLYEYVLESLENKDPSKIKRYCKNIQYTEQQITKWYFKENFVICEKKEKILELKDDISFQALINWVKDYKLLSDEIIEYIDEIRQKRNIVHMKVLINFKKWWNQLNDFVWLLDKYTLVFNEIKNKFQELNKTT